MEKVKMIPLDVLKGYVIFAYRTDEAGRYRMYLKNIELTYERVPDEKKSTLDKLVYTNNKKRLIPKLIDFSEDYNSAYYYAKLEEVKMNLDAIEMMNTYLRIRKKGEILKWDYVQVGDLLNQLKKENRLKNTVKL